MRQRKAAIVGACVVLVACGSKGGPAKAPPLSQEQVIRNFVMPLYPHGVTYDAARALGPQAVPTLIILVDEPGMAPNLSNIVVTLGMLDTAPAEQRLVNFIEAGTGQLTSVDVSVRLDALTALGYAANISATPGLVDYLIKGLELSVWDARVKWSLPSGANPAQRLREQSVAALGLSGKPAALLALENLKATGGGRRGGGPGGGRGGGANLTASQRAQLDDAIEANQFIAANGLSAYTKKTTPR